MLFLALIVDPIYLCNQIRVRWFVIEKKPALIWINYFTTGSENNELGFGRINCHFSSVRHVTGTDQDYLGESPECLFRYLLLL